jgi:hypothetical protein
MNRRQLAVLISVLGGMPALASAANVAANTVVSSSIKPADGTTGQSLTTGSGVKTGHIQDGAVTAAKIAGPLPVLNPLIAQTVFLKGTPIAMTAGSARGIAFDGLHMWVSNNTPSSNQLLRFDYTSNKLITPTITIAESLNQLVFDGTYIWAFTQASKVYRYNTSGAVQTGVTLNGTYSWGAAFDGDYIWASTDYAGGSLERINVISSAITVFSGMTFRGSVAFDGRDIWMAGGRGAGVGAGTTKVNSQTGTPTNWPTMMGPSGITGVAFDGQYVWVQSYDDGVVRKWDPSTNTVVATVTLPEVNVSADLAFDGTFLWVVCIDFDTIYKIDVRTNVIADTIALPAGTYPLHAASDGRYMWVSSDSGAVYKFPIRFK